jgi:acyl-CoA thioesterase-1
MRNKKPAFIWVVLIACLCTQTESKAQNGPVRVACVGNSITEGAGNGDSTYPKQLQVLMGDGYEVRNYGIGGRTLLKHGDYPYWNEAKYTEVKDWNPQIVIIMLGTNDTKPQNWKYANEFVGDYEAFVESFLQLPSHPKVWICYPVPIFKDNYGITESIMKDQVIPDVRQVAKKEKVPVIDLFKALDGHGEYFSDGVHPDKRGDALMADAVYKRIRHYKSIR